MSNVHIKYQALTIASPSAWSPWFNQLARFCLSLAKPLLINSPLAFIALAIATSQGLYHRGNF